MHQVLFRIPWLDVPIYGYGMMLFLALLACTWLASRLARREGIAPERIQDLAIWVFVAGIVGARLTFLIQYHELDPDRPGETFVKFFKLWEGGLVFYGSLVGGFLGYLAAYFVFLRKYRIPALRVADVVAPCAAVGLAIGRVGCLLNGCCYGNVVTCEQCYPHLHFPLSSPARLDRDRSLGLVARGLQTAAGFTSAEDTMPPRVDRVVPGSEAAAAGLRDGDEVLEVNGHATVPTDANGKPLHVLRWWSPKGGLESEMCADEAQWQKARQAAVDAGQEVHGPLTYHLSDEWGRGEARGQTALTLLVRHPGETGATTVGPFYPKTLGLHPTQLYETISMLLLFFVLMAFYPFRRHAGEVMAVFLMAYPVHRFLNEMLRHDTEPFGDGLTLSQNSSVLCFAAGVVLWCWLRYRTRHAEPRPVVVREPVQV
jgi:phosphatidylglycerol:prolipoprotein diacylglycerol transferase